MFNPFKKKKTQWQIKQDRIDQERAEKIRHEAELEERLKLAEEHGKFDAQKKYGNFKNPSGSLFGVLKSTANGVAKGAKKIDTEEVSKRIKKLSKDLEEW